MATYDLTTITTSITNLITTASTVLSDATLSDGVFTHTAGKVAMVTQTLAIPIYGHKYYGRCYQKAPAGHTWGDARFEYYAEDVVGTGLMVFGTMEPTNDEWKVLSSIQELTGEPTGSTWVLRSFVSGGNETSYRKEMLIIDLTETYGAGNEPTKEWCDEYIPYFEGTIPWINNLKLGDVINCPYSGAMKSILLPKGEYFLECWGAQGGTHSTSLGGFGGYSRGFLRPKNGRVLYIYSGGQPVTNGSTRVQTTGGFNGGGKGYNRYYSGTYTYGQGGGGASDIRLGKDSLYARVLVAGGGAGSASANMAAQEHAGGGPFGQTARKGYEAKPTAAGTGGSFGQGGSATTSGNNYKYGSGGGGGGWYGGGASTNYSDSDTQTRRQHSGGSGYVFTSETASYYPDGCLLTEEDYLLDALTIGGGSRIPAYADGTPTIGNSGNGYCRITVINYNYIKDSVYKNSLGVDSIFIGEKIIKSALLGEQKIFPPEPEYLTLARADFDKGTFKNVTPTYLTNQVDGSDGFQITGRPSSSTATPENYFKWEYSVDLTPYNRITFCAKQVATNGLMLVTVTPSGYTSADVVETIIRDDYGSLPTDWFEYELDISKVTGTKILSFVGGHVHSSGATGSSTAYCNIRLWKNK